MITTMCESSPAASSSNACMFVRSGAHRGVHSSPTPRSSDLGALFDAQNNGRIYFTGGAAAATFNNQGTFRRSAGAGALDFANGTHSNNAGTPQDQAGRLPLGNGGAPAGGLSVSGGAPLAFHA